MFILSRKEIYTIESKDKTIVLTDIHEKRFLDNHFLPVVDFLSKKGLHLEIPSVINDWDAKYIYNKLSSEGLHLGKPAEDICLLIYMRLKVKEINLNYSDLFKL